MAQSSLAIEALAARGNEVGVGACGNEVLGDRGHLRIALGDFVSLHGAA